MSSRPDPDAAFAALDALPRVTLGALPTPLEELSRLRRALGDGPRLLAKRDDALPFGFGGNKVRKLALVAADARAAGADTLITCGGIQSNHARATACAAARLGLRSVLVLNGTPPDPPTGNLLLATLAGAEVRVVADRAAREGAMRRVEEEARAAGGRPYLIPLGASLPLGAAAFALAVRELVAQAPPPDAIVCASSSGGTQAGLLVGCALLGLSTRVVGISPDDPAAVVAAAVTRIASGLAEGLGLDPRTLPDPEVDDAFVGAGYGIASPASRDAAELAARREGLFVEHTYTAKALAGLLAHVRAGRWRAEQRVVFWHTGGLPALFA